MTEFTAEEKELILKAIELMFQTGTVRGDLVFVENVVTLAKSIGSKLAIDKEKLFMSTNDVPRVSTKIPASSPK